MIKLRIAAAFAFIGVFAYAAWASKLALSGHRIAKIDTGHYVVTVDRMPWRFSWIAPIEGGRWFPGYIRTKISDARGMELGLFSLHWDSFYPDTASATERRSKEKDYIEVRIDEGTTYIRAAVDSSGGTKWDIVTK